MVIFRKVRTQGKEKRSRPSGPSKGNKKKRTQQNSTTVESIAEGLSQLQIEDSVNGSENIENE